jgi:hypothetical protein
VRWFLTAGLWVHVAAAAWWVLASIIMALAGAVVGGEGVEGKEFLSRVVPAVNRANAFAGALLLVTGAGNVYSAARRRSFAFSTDFTRMLELKLLLYIGMVAALALLFRLERPMLSSSSERRASDMGRLAALSALIAMAGAGAMILGVWLAGA